MLQSGQKFIKKPWTPILSQRHYQHTDQDTGTQLVCDKCPAGTYVSIHCSPTSVRECSPCPKGTFTRGENGVQQCHRCRSPCPAGFIEKTPCTATQDRICTCPPNTFLSGDGAAVCKPHSLCPPGKRVKKQGSEKKDVVCKQCSEGTFSDVKSSATQCRNHTDCQVQGDANILTTETIFSTSSSLLCSPFGKLCLFRLLSWILLFHFLHLKPTPAPNVRTKLKKFLFVHQAMLIADAQIKLSGHFLCVLCTASPCSPQMWAYVLETDRSDITYRYRSDTDVNYWIGYRREIKNVIQSIKYQKSTSQNLPHGVTRLITVARSSVLK
uniref:TNFR-Cys domain-containing protein n=1 Tax=Haplochromis burtoni TaxID=8153 RepID=A0A3Q2WUE9_HAPBU